MVMKIGGVWTMHCPTDEQEVLLRFLERLDSEDEKRHEFCVAQKELIMRACYVPQIVSFCEYGREPEITEEERILLDEIEFYKANFLSIMSTNFSVAAFNGLITTGEKSEFDNYVQTLFGY